MSVIGHNLGPNWAELLKSWRQRAGLSKTQLARRLSVTVGYISKLEAGQKPPRESQRQALAEILGLSDQETEEFHIAAELERADPATVKYLARLAELQTDRVEEPPREAGESAEHEHSLPLIPIINKVAAGYPREFTDLDYPTGIADDYVSVPDVTDPNAFAFHVYGDSMEPDFQAGVLLIAAPNTVPFDGDACFVRFSAVGKVSGCTFKRVYFMTDGRIRLVPANRKYPEQIYARDDVNGIWPVVRQYAPISRTNVRTPMRVRRVGGRSAGGQGNQTSAAAG